MLLSSLLLSYQLVYKLTTYLPVKGGGNLPNKLSTPFLPLGRATTPTRNYPFQYSYLLVHRNT
jgi:hypothetical protein